MSDHNYFYKPSTETHEKILDIIQNIVNKHSKKYDNCINIQFRNRYNYNSYGMHYSIIIRSEYAICFDIISYSNYLFVQCESIDVKYKTIYAEIIKEIAKEFILFATTISYNDSWVKTIYKNNLHLLEYFYNPNEHHKIRLYCSRTSEELKNEFKGVSSEFNLYCLYEAVNFSLHHTDCLRDEGEFSITKNGFPNCCGIDCVIIKGDKDYTDVAEKVISMKDELYYKGAILVFLNDKLYSINVIHRSK